MSGKKKSDVTTVLKDADKSRKMLYEKHLSEFERLKKEFSVLKEKIKNSSLSIDDALTQMSKLQEGLEKNNKMISDLSTKMANTTTSHYMDDEFALAQSYLKTYKSIDAQMNEVNDLIRTKHDKLLEEHHKQAKEQKQKLLYAKLDVVQGRIDNISYVNPLNQEIRLSLQESSKMFLKNSDIYDGVVQGLKKMKQQIADGTIDSVDKFVGEALEKIRSLEERLDEKYIEIQETIQTTVAIEDTLHELGYSYETTMVGESVLDGVSIVTTDPARLQFSLNNVVVHKGDKNQENDLHVEFNIDEASSSCMVTANGLSQKLKTKGINFQITDWGSASHKKVQTNSTQESLKGV